MSESEPDFEALSDAADSVRRLTAHLRKTKAPASLIAEVEAGVAFPLRLLRLEKTRARPAR